MSRIRTIKPEFFLHEDLFDLEKTSGFPIRVAFAGLWTQSDREGRFKWKVRTLKVAILPHDELDFSRVLDALWSRGFVEKYTGENGEELGYIPSFPDHQAINFKESLSILPEPTPERIVAREDRVSLAKPSRTPRVDDGKEGKGKERKGRKEGEGQPPAAPAPPKPGKVKKTRENFIPPDQGQIRSFVQKLRGEDWGPEKCRFVADSCLDHYRMNKWVQGKGKPIVDWHATVRQWIRREESGEFGPPATRAQSLPATTRAAPAKAIPDVVRRELDFFYQRWRENESAIPSGLDGIHYNALKEDGLVNFSSDQTEQIRRFARLEMASRGQEGASAEISLMKKFGIIEFFKTLKANGATQVYTPTPV